jgi:hypothetical protein
MDRAKKTYDNDRAIEESCLDRRTALKSGAVLLTAAAGGTFAPSVMAKTRAKAILSGPGPIITDVSPTAVSTGTLLTIDGAGFGNIVENECIQIINGPQIAFVRAVSVSEQQITADVRFIPPGMTSGRVQVAVGEGAFVTPVVPGSFEFLEDPFFWQDNGTPPAISSQVLSLSPSLAEKGITCINGFTNVSPGVSFVQVTLTGLPAICDPGASLIFQMDIGINDPDGVWPTNSIFFDQAVSLGIVSPVPLPVCLATICGALEDIFLSRVMPNPAQNIDCTAVISGSSADIFILLPSGITFLGGSVWIQACV